MRDRPSGADLLAIARETFMKEILPALGPDQRLTGLMIANALGIVGREIAAGEAMKRQMLAALAALYAEAPSHDPEALDRELQRLALRLAQDLRARAFQGNQARLAAIHRLLCDEARARVREANPKYLDLGG
jgi:hypothetical protein